MTPLPFTKFLNGLTLAVSLSVCANHAVATPPLGEQEIHISKQALDKALVNIGKTYNIVLIAPQSLTTGKSAPPVSGVMGAEQALKQLLIGSGLVAHQSHDGAFIIQRKGSANTSSNRSSIEEITVTAFGRQRSDTLKTIPQSISVFDQTTFEIVSASSVGDILRLSPNATRAGSSLDMFADDFLIRGFGAEQSYNGLGFSQTDHPTDLANVERLEILKGPSSVLYGRMEPGGTINVVTKQPLAEFAAEAGVEYGSHNRRRTTLDVTGPLSDNVRARLNLAHQDSNSAIDHLNSKRSFIAPNISIDLSEKTNLTVEGSYSTNEWVALNGGTPIEGALTDNPNGDYSKDLNPAWKDSKTTRDSKTINARLSHALTDSIDARISYTYTHNEANWAEYAPFGLNQTDKRTLDRIIFAGRNTYKKDHDIILDLTGEVQGETFTHKFITGINYRKSDLYRPTQIYTADALDLFNPQYGPTVLSSSNQIRDRTLEQDDKVLSVFVQDRISFAEDWHILGGLRYTDSEQSQVNINHRNGNSANRDELNQSDWSTQVGIVYDINNNASLYANRSESFVPQEGTTSGKKPLEAEESTQHEIGMRYSLDSLQINIAGFIITKENIAIDDPLDDDFEVAKGRARSKGIELSMHGYVNSAWYLGMAYGYTDTEILKSDDTELEGNQFSNIPKHTASIQTRYDLSSISGLSVGGSLTHMGKRFGNDENGFKLNSHTQLDLAAYYSINESLQIDLLLNNALDEKIFSPGAYDGIVREPGRNYLARIKYAF